MVRCDNSGIVEVPDFFGKFSDMKKERVIAYIDGFNLFYTSLKGTKNKWLDIYSFCNSFLKEHQELVCVKYFSARVSSTPSDQNKTNRQMVYLNALKTNPKIDIKLGFFSMHDVKMPEVASFYQGKIKLVDVVKMEEKGTDVNLAVQLVSDAYEDKFDYAMLFSNDSDMAKAVEIVCKNCNKRIGLYVHKKANTNKILTKNVCYIKRISQSCFVNNQFDDVVITADGKKITKPVEW